MWKVNEWIVNRNSISNTGSFYDERLAALSPFPLMEDEQIKFELHSDFCIDNEYGIEESSDSWLSVREALNDSRVKV